MTNQMLDNTPSPAPALFGTRKIAVTELLQALDVLGASRKVVEHASRSQDSVVFIASKGKLKLCTAVPDFGARSTWMLGEAEGEWCVGVHSARLIGLLETLEGEVELSIWQAVTDNKAKRLPGLQVRTAHGTVFFHGVQLQQDPDGTPTICNDMLKPASDATPCLTMKRTDLERMVHATLWATAPDRTRYSLNAMLIEARRDGDAVETIAVGSNGKELSMITLKERVTLDGSKGWPLNALVSSESLKFIQRLHKAADIPDEIQLRIRNTGMASSEILEVTCGSFRHTYPMVAGLYPAFRQVLPTFTPEKGGRVTTLKLADFLGLTRASSRISDDCDDTRAWTFQILNERLRCTSLRVDATSFWSEIPCRHIELPMEKPRKIGFDMLLVQEALDFLHSEGIETIGLQTHHEDAAGVIETHLPDGFSYYYLVMPVDLEQDRETDPWLIHMRDTHPLPDA